MTTTEIIFRVVEVKERMSVDRVFFLAAVSGFVSTHVFGKPFMSGVVLGLWIGLIA